MQDICYGLEIGYGDKNWTRAFWCIIILQVIQIKVKESHLDNNIKVHMKEFDWEGVRWWIHLFQGYF